MRLEVELAAAQQALGRMEELERELQKYRCALGEGGWADGICAALLFTLRGSACLLYLPACLPPFSQAGQQ